MNNKCNSSIKMLNKIKDELAALREDNNLRILLDVDHEGRNIIVEGQHMLNFSSNDYLGLGVNTSLRREFFVGLTVDSLWMSSSSSRLLTGNFTVHTQLETLLCELYNSDGALIFNSGYHANIGILKAISNEKTLIIADKLVHASLIDGMRLCDASHIRCKHNDIEHLGCLLKKHAKRYKRVIVVTESIFSMNGDEADLEGLVALKKTYPNVLIYLDEAHAFGVRGAKGLGCAEEKGCIAEIDFLVGTFGKALASVGAFVICAKEYRELLVNKMRSFIFTTALPPINIQWTLFLLRKLPLLVAEREHLAELSKLLREALVAKGYECPSTSHIVPLITGDSAMAIEKAKEIQRKGVYALPVRPPTVPKGASRIRFSLSANLSFDEIATLVSWL